MCYTASTRQAQQLLPLLQLPIESGAGGRARAAPYFTHIHAVLFDDASVIMRKDIVCK